MLKSFILLLAILTVIVTGRLTDPGNFFELARVKTFDFYNRITPRIPVENRPVFIADIDEKSLAEIGQWPWSRDILARLIDTLADYETMAIGFDALLSEPDRIPPELAAQQAHDVTDEERNDIRNADSTEAIMAKSMQRHRVVIAQSTLRTKIPERTISEASRQTSIKSYRLNNGATKETLNSFLWTYPSYLPNVEALEAAASGRGFINISDENDGIVRRIPLLMKADGVLKPGFALELLRVALGVQSLLVLVDPGGVAAIGLNIPQGQPAIIPVDSNGRIWVNFAEPAKRSGSVSAGSLYYSVADILHERIPRDVLQGRIAIVGTSAVGLKDIHHTAITPYLPGVEVHANIIESIVSGQMVSRAKTNLLIELGLAVILCLLAPVAVLRLRPMQSLGVVLAATSGTVAYSWFEYSRNLNLFDATFPIASLLLVYFVFAFVDYQKADANRQI